MRLLRERCPDWFIIARSAGGYLEGTAKVPGSPWPAGIALSIRNSAKLRVYETIPGTAFPARCPERHIELDGNFCLGIDTVSVVDTTAADRWWEALRQYLLCQAVAERSRIWPDRFALDHGGAGEWHARALELASDLGIEDEYDRTHADEPSWISDPKARIVHRDGRPINARTPCPLGCRWQKRGRTISRLRADCDQREKVNALVLAERERRRELANYWSRMRKAGIECCGRMRDCELRKGAPV